MHPSESHAWFRAATLRQRVSIYNQGARASEDWRMRLHDYQERVDLRTVAPRISPNLAARAAARASVELAIIVALFPDKVSEVLRISWE